jgi:hypothetical protein
MRSLNTIVAGETNVFDGLADVLAIESIAQVPSRGRNME